MDNKNGNNNVSNNVNNNSLILSSNTTNGGTSGPSNSRKVSYIYELPYITRKSLCDVLDADYSWKQLGGHYMGLSDTKLTLISHALYRNASPTNELLIKWESSNAKVSQLYRYLALMKHQRAMFLLKPFVDEKLKTLCPDFDEDQHFGTQLTDETMAANNHFTLNHKFISNETFGANNNKFDYFSSPSNPMTEKKILNKDLNDLDNKSKTCNNDINVNDNNFKCDFNEKRSESRVESISEEMEVPYKELLIATDDFCNERVLGSGGFGIVYKGEWKGTNVAIKRLKGCDNISQALTELKVLNRYRIDNILPIYGVSLDGPEPCLVYQYMPNGSLEDRLLCKGCTKPLSWPKRINIGEGIARALNYLHTLKGNAFVHGDVKSANVLLDPLFEPKLGDFGLARQVVGGNGLYTHCTVSAVHGTSVYLPFEYLRQKILSPAVDVYSYGIVLLEMSTGKRAFDGKKLLIDLVEEEVKIAEKINSKDFSKLKDLRMSHVLESGNWFDCLLELGRKCAHKSKTRRPQMIQVLEYYNQCKTSDRIRRLSLEAQLNKDSISISKSNIKTPLELQLWYDMVRKSGGQQSETVCPTVGTQNNMSDFEESQLSIEVPNHELVDEVPPQETELSSNVNCAPMLPLITELGFVNNREDSQ